MAGDERVELPSAVLETAVLAIKLIPCALQQRSELYREKVDLSTKKYYKGISFMRLRNMVRSNKDKECRNFET
jgi:hypothetical protein